VVKRRSLVEDLPIRMTAPDPIIVLTVEISS